jgi:RNA polymerase sigma-70 factor (ECF subfamily)
VNGYDLFACWPACSDADTSLCFDPLTILTSVQLPIMTSGSSFATQLSMIDRLRHQDGAAWSQFVELYGPLVLYWCRQQKLPNEIADECTQEIFLSVVRHLDQFKIREGGSFRGWLWQITRRKIIDTVRTRQRTVEASGDTQAAIALANLIDPLWVTDFSEEERTEPYQVQLLMQRAIDQVQSEFEPKTWQAFERTVIDGQSTAAVAEQMNLTPGTVRQHRTRILRRLRQQLGEL